MELPKFLLGDNTDFPDSIFVIHLDFPRFIVDLSTDDLEILEEIEDEEEEELQAELEQLVVEANAFYDREVARYDQED